MAGDKRASNQAQEGGGARKRIGRPPKKLPQPGERVSLGLRVTAEIKQKLDAAAEASGRSQSQEAELRLDRSFQDDFLTKLGVNDLARSVAVTFIGRANSSALDRGRPAMSPDTPEASAEDVLSDPVAFDAGLRGALYYLLSMQQKDGWQTPEAHTEYIEIINHLAERAALNVSISTRESEIERMRDRLRQQLAAHEAAARYAQQKLADFEAEHFGGEGSEEQYKG